MDWVGLGYRFFEQNVHIRRSCSSPNVEYEDRLLYRTSGNTVFTWPAAHPVALILASTLREVRCAHVRVGTRERNVTTYLALEHETPSSAPTHIDCTDHPETQLWRSVAPHLTSYFFSFRPGEVIALLRGTVSVCMRCDTSVLWYVGVAFRRAALYSALQCRRYWSENTAPVPYYCILTSLPARAAVSARRRRSAIISRTSL